VPHHRNPKTADELSDAGCDATGLPAFSSRPVKARTDSWGVAYLGLRPRLSNAVPSGRTRAADDEFSAAWQHRVMLDDLAVAELAHGVREVR
jgi:hypothetical protein